MPIVLAAHEVFAAPDDEKLKEYSTRLSKVVESIMSTVASGKPTADETETKASMGELYRYFRQCGFSAAELISGKI